MVKIKIVIFYNFEKPIYLDEFINFKKIDF